MYGRMNSSKMNSATKISICPYGRKRSLYMELLQLKYFSHAAKTENFSKTAQNFMVPASGISASIKKLESELGVELFDRTANSIALNEYGRILLSAIDKSEELFNKAKTDIFDLSQTPFGEFRLLIHTNRQKITSLISEFIKKYPKILFNIKHQGIISPSHINDYDIIVTDMDIESDHFHKHFWFREELFLATHKNSRLAKKSYVSSMELGDERFICMTKGSSLRRCTDIYFERKNLNPDIIIECDDPQYIRNYLNMGLGVTLFPETSWKNQITDDIALLKIDDGLYRDSYIYINKSSSKAVGQFLQMLKANK